MTLDDAADAAERAEWEAAPYLRIEGADGQTVVACHDLSKISHADARLLAAAPVMRAELQRSMEQLAQLAKWLDDLKTPAAFHAAEIAARYGALLARIDGRPA